MTINTFDDIKQFINPKSDDEFWHLQILKRKKENPELGSNSLVLKTHYITSVEHLEKLMPSIINLCKSENARAMINLNRRSFEQIAFQMLRKVSEQIFNKDFKSVRKSYENVCGKFGSEKDKKWIIDIDVNDPSVVKEVQEFIDGIQPEGTKTLVVLRTKNGFHIITKPFRLDIYNKKFPEHEVHKNNPMNLYIPEQLSFI